MNINTMRNVGLGLHCIRVVISSACIISVIQALFIKTSAYLIRTEKLNVIKTKNAGCWLHDEALIKRGPLLEMLWQG